GGAIGTQLDKVMQESPTADSTNSQLEQQQQEQQEQQQNPFQSPQANDPNGESGTELDAGEKVDSAPGVVLINTLLFNGAGAGTGMILDSDGLILTNYHVVTGSETVSVTVSDTGEEYEAEVLGHDAVRDVAVLQITDGSGFDTVQTDTADLSEGDAVSAIGNGSGQGYLTELQGSVTGLDQTITAMDEMSASSDGEVLTGLISTDADVVPGYSGGPLVNESGAVVGMTTAASQGTTSEQVSGYAVPISTALDIADQISSGNITSDTIVMGKSAALGVTVAGGNTPGAQIVEVLEGSAAADAGLTEGDTITALDGNSVNNASVLSSLVKEYEIGDTVTLDVTTQDGSQKQVDVKLGKSTVN
ncbi:MAG: S1C family serine protease, partial [Ancrocorticia populi]|uniref:S1C family serine protease n=1 Tax=Ancrocorticia populi TaxID=2175228 RepID=UPI003F8E7066